MIPTTIFSYYKRRVQFEVPCNIRDELIGIHGLDGMCTRVNVLHVSAPIRLPYNYSIILGLNEILNKNSED